MPRNAPPPAGAPCGVRFVPSMVGRMDESSSSEWTAAARQVVTAAEHSKQIGEAGVLLQQRYAGAESRIRSAIDAEISNWLTGNDKQLQFEGLTLVRTNKIVSAVPNLHKLAETVRSQTDPESEYLSARVNEILAELTKLGE